LKGTKSSLELRYAAQIIQAPPSYPKIFPLHDLGFADINQQILVFQVVGFDEVVTHAVEEQGGEHGSIFWGLA
jgi:hypothetical protein